MKSKLVVGLIFAAAAGALWGVDAAWAAEKSAFSFYWNNGWRIVNFLILAGLLFKLLKEPAAHFFKGKREEAEASIAELEEARTKAQAELDELKAKLAEADRDMAEILEKLKTMALKGRESIIHDAQNIAEEIIYQAKVIVENELARAKAELLASSAEAVIASARTKLASRLTPADQERLLSEALAKMKRTTVSS